jgi:hypothetical protein
LKNYRPLSMTKNHAKQQGHPRYMKKPPGTAVKEMRRL